MADVKQPAAATKPAATKPAATKPVEKKPAPAAEKPAAAKPAEQKPAAKPVVKKPGPFDPLTLVKDVNDRLQLCAARYSPCGKFILAGSMIGTVCRWDATTDDFAALEDWTGHGGFVSGLVFGPQGGNRVYTGDSWGRLRAWDYTASTGKPLWDVADAHAKWLRSVACSPDGKLLATCGLDQTVRLWDAATGKKLAELTDHAASGKLLGDVLDVAFSPDGKTLASGDLSGKVKLWNVADRKLLRDLDAKSLYAADRLQDVGGARVLRFTLDGKTLVVGGTTPKNGGNVQGTATLLLFDVATGKETKQLKLDVGAIYVSDVAMHADGYLIITGEGNPGTGQLALWRPSEEKPFYVAPRIANLYAAGLHPDGRRFLVTSINPNNAGNGAVKKKDSAEYVSNFSPIKVFELPETFGPAA